MIVYTQALGEISLKYMKYLKPSFAKIFTSIIIFVLILLLWYITHVSTGLGQTGRMLIMVVALFWAIVAASLYYLLHSYIEAKSKKN